MTAPDRAFAPLVSHVIRLGFAETADAAARERSIRTFNRFKQTAGPTSLVVGRDVSARDGFEYAQISTFASVEGFRDYFYDPIHLAADREADREKAIARGAGFDIIPAWRDDLRDRLRAVGVERRARFAENDDRPMEPPVADRAEDQVWGLGATLFYLARLGLEPGAPANSPRRVAFERLVQLAGDRTVAAGRETGAPAPGLEGWSMIIRFAGEADYRAWARSSAHDAAIDAGLFEAGQSDVFFVIDPQDDGLAKRLSEI